MTVRTATLSSALVILCSCAGDGPPPSLPLGAIAEGGSTSSPVSGSTSSPVSGSTNSPESGSTTGEGPTGPVSECGNGDVEDGEACDGAKLAGETCESQGYSDNGLTCVGCQLDVSGCGPVPGMVDVPGGIFEMGSDYTSSQQPIRMVQVDRFWMDETEVTVAEYAACELAGACTPPADSGNCNWMVVGRDDHPVNCVTWFQAEDYCGWVQSATKRLPTEAEWEKAARSTDAREYPWGDAPAPSCTHVVMNEGGGGCGLGSMWEVGSKPLGDSRYGSHDMAGNVWEWVADWYASGYDSMETDNPSGPALGSSRVLRGGSWYSNGTFNFRAANRNNSDPSGSYDGVGFRCARTPPAPL